MPEWQEKKKKSLTYLNMDLLPDFIYIFLPFLTPSSLSYSLFQLQAPVGWLEMTSCSPWTGWGKTHKEKCTRTWQAAAQATTAEAQRAAGAQGMRSNHTSPKAEEHNTKAVPIIGSWRWGKSVTAAVLVLPYHWKSAPERSVSVLLKCSGGAQVDMPGNKTGI